jgi:hypothetical protein
MDEKTEQASPVALTLPLSQAAEHLDLASIEVLGPPS